MTLENISVDFRTQYLTPQARTIGFVALSDPQGYQGSEPAYSCKIVLDNERAQPLIETINTAHASAGEYLNAISEKFGNRPKLTAAKLRKHAPLPYEEEVTEDGEETGKFIFKFRQACTIYRKGEKDPFNLPIMDSNRVPMSEPIYAGSKIVIKFSIKPWFVDSMGLGVSLRPQAVQVIELVSSTSGVNGAEFESVPGGYVAQAAAEMPPVATDSNDDDPFGDEALL